MSSREILDILYAEVIMASRAAEDTKGGPAQSHKTAMAALQKAVERYTDYSLEGKVPEDLKTEVQSAS